MVADLAAQVRIRAAREQKPCQPGVVRDACRTVERALEGRRGLMLGLEETSIGIRAGVEQRLRRTDEVVLAAQTQIAREAEVREGVPAIRPARYRSQSGVLNQQPPHAVVIAQDRTRVDVAYRDLRMGGEDRLRIIEGARWMVCARRTGRDDELVSHCVW